MLKTTLEISYRTYLSTVEIQEHIAKKLSRDYQIEGEHGRAIGGEVVDEIMRTGMRGETSKEELLKRAYQMAIRKIEPNADRK